MRTRPVWFRNLMSEGYGVTKLATTGGFLRAGNTTLLVGVDDDKFDGAMKVIEHVCKSRKQIATSPSPIAGTTRRLRAVSGRGHGRRRDDLRAQRRAVRENLTGGKTSKCESIWSDRATKWNI